MFCSAEFFVELVNGLGDDELKVLESAIGRRRLRMQQQDELRLSLESAFPLNEEEAKMIASHNRVDAIKSLRQRYGLSFRDAAAIVGIR